MFFSKKERKDSKTLYTLTRTDSSNPLASYSKHSFELDGFEWPSVEHYYQAMKFVNPAYATKVRQAAHPADATKLGKSWFQKKRPDWDKVKMTVMTRGTYIKCRTHPEVASALLETKALEITDVSLYDYYWGSGRDMRGNNTFGKVLMNVRAKLLEDQADS